MNSLNLRFARLFPIAVTTLAAITLSLPGSASGADTERSSNRFETSAFVAEIVAAPGPFKAGTDGSVRVVLTTKGEFHINEQYPYRFKTGAAPDGVSYPRAVLQRGDGRFEKTRAVFDLPFRASRPGRFEIGGTFHLSACSANSCLVEKPTLTTAVAVQ